MSGTIRSRMEAQRDRHMHYDTSDRIPDQGRCDHCHHKWPCPDRVAADDTLADLNNAAQYPLPAVHSEGYVQHAAGHYAYRLIPDPDSRGAT